MVFSHGIIKGLTLNKSLPSWTDSSSQITQYIWEAISPPQYSPLQAQITGPFPFNGWVLETQTGNHSDLKFFGLLTHISKT